jgi:hypothetical protein
MLAQIGGRIAEEPYPPRSGSCGNVLFDQAQHVIDADTDGKVMQVGAAAIQRSEKEVVVGIDETGQQGGASQVYLGSAAIVRKSAQVAFGAYRGNPAVGDEHSVGGRRRVVACVHMTAEEEHASGHESAPVSPRRGNPGCW